MAGGYGHDLETTVQVQINTYRVALEYRARWAALTSERDFVFATVP